MTSAGSPGRSCCSEKMSTDTKNNVGMSCNSRLPRNVSMAFARLVRSLFQLQSDHAHETVSHLPITLKPRRVSDQHARVIEVENRRISQDDLGQFFINRLALRRVGGNARLVEQIVDFRVAIAGIIQGRLALVEGINVAVGISAAAPAEEKGLILAGLGLLERCCELGQDRKSVV